MQPIPVEQRFYVRDVEHLAAEIARLGIDLPRADFGEMAMGQALDVSGGTIGNRFCACVLTGHDAAAEGRGDALLLARYRRYGAGGYGMVVSEPVACHVNQRHTARQLYLGGRDDPGLGGLVAALHEGASSTHAAAPLCMLLVDGSIISIFRKSPDYLHKIISAVVAAGWRGLQLDVPLALLCDAGAGASDPIGALLSWLQQAFPKLLLGVRLCVYDADPQGGGFGADSQDYRTPDPTRPLALTKAWAQQGMVLLHMQMTYPPRKLAGELGAAIPECDVPQEHPLRALARTAKLAAAFKAELPNVALMVGGFSWLRDLMPAFAGAWIGGGILDLVGLGRFALAYPQAPQQFLQMGALARACCCTQCGACTLLQAQGAPVGCVLQDPATYGPIFRFQQRYTRARVQSEARRCHQCNPAPCSSATPGKLEIPGIMRAVAAGDLQRAGSLLRRQQPLAEMCAVLSPYSAAGEQRCVETIFSGRAVAIRDVLYQAAVFARDQAVVPIPADATGQKVVVLGGGPAGLAATATLLEAGHHVLLLDKGTDLGGVPATLIPSERFGGNQEEITVMLREALRGARLRVMSNTEIKDPALLRRLQSDADAFLLATGLWQDRPCITASPPQGVYGGLAFLAGMKTGSWELQPRRVVVFAGSDCAMDAAVLVQRLGAEQVMVVYDGPRSRMPWCLEESWFGQEGVSLLTWCKPVAYVVDAAGHVEGIRVQHCEPGVPGQGVMGLLHADLVVDATGLVLDAAIPAAWPDLVCSEAGCLADAPDGGYATTYPGLFVVGAIRNGCASVPQCVQEGREAGWQMAQWLKEQA